MAGGACLDSSGLNASALLAGLFPVLEWDESIASPSLVSPSETSLLEQGFELDAHISQPKTPSNDNGELAAFRLPLQNPASPQRSGHGIWTSSPERDFIAQSSRAQCIGNVDSQSLTESRALSPVRSPSVDSMPSLLPADTLVNRPMSATSSVFTQAPLLPSEREHNLDDADFTVSFHALNDSVASPSVLIRSLQLDLSELVTLGQSPTRKHLSDEQVRDLPSVRFDEPDMQSCSVCLEAFRQGMLLTRLQCGHVFHVSCFAEWAQRSAVCPNCRASALPS